MARSDLSGQFRLLLLEAARGEPGEKPDDFAEMIDELWCANLSGIGSTNAPNRVLMGTRAPSIKIGFCDNPWRSPRLRR